MCEMPKARTEPGQGYIEAGTQNVSLQRHGSALEWEVVPRRDR